MDQPNIVIIYIGLPVSVNKQLKPQDMEDRYLKAWVDFASGFNALFNTCSAHCHKIGEGVYLAEEAACYPAILELTEMCAKDHLSLVIAPIGDCLTISQECQGLQEWLSQRGNSVRLTRFARTAQTHKA